MDIIGPPSALRTTVEANLPTGASSLFRSQMLPELWAAALLYGIDPVGMVAQSGKETGWGTFGGRVRPEFYNPAGIKVRHIDLAQQLIPTDDGDHPLVHQMFPNWRVGAVAHAQHLVAYTGGTVPGLVVDPRYTLVGPPFVMTWAGLGGRWAPSPTYGLEIEDIMRRLTSEA
ncbi:MAG: glucosaminidase domain-containing protein [Acidimicrobiia bacterium]